MKKMFVVVLLAVVVFLSVSIAPVFAEDKPVCNPCCEKVKVIAKRGLQGAPGPRGPVGQVPEWYLWLAIAGLGTGVLGTLLAAVALTRQPVMVQGQAPIVINNQPPAQNVN